MQTSAACAAQASASAVEASTAAEVAHLSAGEAAEALLLTKQAELQAVALLRGGNAAALLKVRACASHRLQGCQLIPA